MVSQTNNIFPLEQPKNIPLYSPRRSVGPDIKIQSAPSVHSAIYLLFIYQICGRSWQAQQWRVADNRENWASWMFALQTGLERRSLHAHPSTRSAGLFERALLFLCASISAHADNCFFVPTIENVFMKREELFQQVISGYEMFMIIPLSLLERHFYIDEQCVVSIIADV